MHVIKLVRENEPSPNNVFCVFLKYIGLDGMVSSDKDGERGAGCGRGIFS